MNENEFLCGNRLPDYIPFARYDNTAGEDALLDAAPVREHGLQLLCGVPHEALVCRRQTGGGPPLSGRADYLLCRGEEVLLAVELTGRELPMDPPLRVPELPLVSVAVEQMAAGQVSDIVQALEHQLHGEGKTVWQHRLRELPAQRLDVLTAQYMVMETDTGPVPTEYGTSCGLVGSRGAGRPDILLCTEEVADCLPRELRRPPSLPRKIIPLAERVQRLQELCYSNEAFSTRLPEELKTMALQRYMEGCPEELQRLQEILPPGCVTYTETVRHLHDLLYSGEDERFAQGAEAIRLLATPAENYTKAQRGLRMLFRWNDDKPVVIRRTTQKDTLPPGIRNVGLQERIRVWDEGIPAGERLVQMPLIRFWQGISVASGLEYPLWFANTLLRFYDVPQSYTYGHMLEHACRMMQQENAKEDSNFVEQKTTGLYTLYLLLVYPFRILQVATEATQEKEEP